MVTSDIVSPLRMNLQVANFREMRTVAPSMSGVPCCRCAASASCAFVCFIEYNSAVSLLQAQDVRNRHKSNGDVVGIAKKHQLSLL